jgi:hypothetical protein
MSNERGAVFDKAWAVKTRKKEEVRRKGCPSIG